MKINCLGRMTSLLLLGLLGAAAFAGLAAASQSEQDLTARARAIHERVITLDTHNDIDPSNLTRACNYTMNLTTQVNLPKMKAGGLDVSFMIVYVGQSNPPKVADAFQPSGYDRAFQAAVAKFDAIHRLTKPTDNTTIESFNGRFREECLNVHWFASLEDVQQKIDAFRHRPHRALKGLSPREFARRAVTTAANSQS